MLAALIAVLALQPGAALLSAAERGDVETVKTLLEEGVEPDSRNELGPTALMLASQAGRIGVVRALLDAEADPNAMNDREMDALGLASFGGYLDVVELLVEGGAHVSRRMQVSGTTPITLAVRRGHTNIVRALLASGARVDGPVGTAALITAAWLGDEGITRILVEAGAPLEGTDAWGWSPLTAATQAGNDTLAEWLREPGAPERAAREDASSRALLTAALRGEADVVALLLRNGADPNQRDRSGATALILAAGTGHAAVVERLLEYGADVDLETRDGFSARAAARERGDDAILELLERVSSEKERERNC